MKMIITEKQLARILGKHQEIDEIDNITSDKSTTPSSSTSSSVASGEPGSSPGAEDYPPYPEVDHAEDLVKRGVANPVDYTKKHEDYPEANPVRGRANPIKGM
jgi:hypothetical protein